MDYVVRIVSNGKQEPNMTDAQKYRFLADREHKRADEYSAPGREIDLWNAIRAREVAREYEALAEAAEA